MNTEKQVSYESRNTYGVLNEFTAKTKNVWLVCHGIGYLSRYFLKYFKHLDPEENFIIAPQAPSKYYLNGKYIHVGASWLTRENTEQDIENVLNYLDVVYKAENLEKAPQLILFGYSQGVSVVTRWVARRKISCDHLVMHSGKVPAELETENFSFLKNSKFSFLYGTQDQYFAEADVSREKERLIKLFPSNFEIQTFEGGHEVNKDLISEIAKN
jgi:predicted esterase